VENADGKTNLNVEMPASETEQTDVAFEADSLNISIIINKLPTDVRMITSSVLYESGKYFVAALKDINGRAIDGVKVSVKLSNGRSFNLKTDKNGQIQIPAGNLAPNKYTVKITFDGNNNYVKIIKTVNVAVKKAKPKLTAKKKTFKRSVKTKKYVVILKTSKNKAIKKAKVTLKVNKKTFSVKTNSKGKVTFKITGLNKKGKFKAAVTYKGNKYYVKVTKKVYILVK
ncbi:carboxypeptidase-like regulatory domain-containing protein, partial [uncultured Methanobrevibacter sp.]|uniref:carboxypeptidase-like regulatory domain-containing protein n=1 Tax=uncultured Methanobrevibacter sp. TaxID=253161 RepID=UPI0025F06B72